MVIKSSPRDAPCPGWDASTTVVRELRDRMYELGWADGPTVELPVCGPACELERRPLDLGVGLWR